MSPSSSQRKTTMAANDQSATTTCRDWAKPPTDIPRVDEPVQKLSTSEKAPSKSYHTSHVSLPAPSRCGCCLANSDLLWRYCCSSCTWSMARQLHWPTQTSLGYAAKAGHPRWNLDSTVEAHFVVPLVMFAGRRRHLAQPRLHCCYWYRFGGLVTPKVWWVGIDEDACGAGNECVDKETCDPSKTIHDSALKVPN